MNEHESTKSQEQPEPTSQPSIVIATPRRRRKIKVRPYRDPNRPTLKYVVGYRESGRRRRSFFETKGAADAFAVFKNAERQQSGIQHSEFPEGLRIMAQDAMEALQPFGKTIKDAVAHYVAHLKANERSCSAVELVKQLLKAKEAAGVGERHLGTLRSRLNYFAEEFDNKLVAEITATNIDDWLRSLDVGTLTRNHYRSVLVSAFKFARRHGYAVENPAEGASKAKVISGRPGILEVEQASALLCNAPTDIVPFLGIGLFAGLRRAELEKLDWSEVDFESGLIQVTAEKSKTAKRRFVTLQPNLREWLLPYRKRKGNVTQHETFRQSFNQARIAAGIVDWPENCLRHSFASYHLAHFKNAAATALELGHHDSRVTFAHYRELVKPVEAARYWLLKPAGRSRKIVQMATR
jgi:integrase